MKIVEIIPSLRTRAGAETLFVDLSCELKNQSHDVYSFVLYNNLNDDYKKKIESKSIQICEFGKKRGIDIECAKKLRQKLKMINPDVVHLHLGCLMTYFIAFGFKKQTWSLFQTCHNIAKKESNFLNRFLKRIYFKKKLLHFVAISDLIKKSITKYYGPKINVSTVYNGVSLEKKQRDFDLKRNYDLIIVARFCEQKNYLYLFDRFSEIIKINDKLNLICLGDGPLLNECKEYVKNKQLNNIFFEGSVNNVFDYLLKSKIFVLVSKYEGNPISILEAMNAGLPIISSNVGGVSDIIKNDINGYLFDLDNPLRFTEKVLYLLKNKLVADQMGKTNMNEVEKYSIENCCKNYLKLFMEKSGE